MDNGEFLIALSVGMVMVICTVGTSSEFVVRYVVRGEVVGISSVLLPM